MKEKELQPDGTWRKPTFHKKNKDKIRKELNMVKCRYCLSTENLTIDHKIPKVQGGTDERKNLQCLCYDCNQFKSGLSHKQVIRLFGWLTRINKSRKEHGKRAYGEPKIKIKI